MGEVLAGEGIWACVVLVWVGEVTCSTVRATNRTEQAILASTNWLSMS